MGLGAVVVQSTSSVPALLVGGPHQVPTTPLQPQVQEQRAQVGTSPCEVSLAHMPSCPATAAVPRSSLQPPDAQQHSTGVGTDTGPSCAMATGQPYVWAVGGCAPAGSSHFSPGSKAIGLRGSCSLHGSSTWAAASAGEADHQVLPRALSRRASAEDGDDGGNGCIDVAADVEDMEAVDGAGGDLNEDGGGADDAVSVWLERHGLARWRELFKRAEVDESVVPHLCEADLQEVGVDSPRQRQAIIAAAACFEQEVQQQQQQDEGLGCGDEPQPWESGPTQDGQQQVQEHRAWAQLQGAWQQQPELKAQAHHSGGVQVRAQQAGSAARASGPGRSYSGGAALPIRAAQGPCAQPSAAGAASRPLSCSAPAPGQPWPATSPGSGAPQPTAASGGTSDLGATATAGGPPRAGGAALPFAAMFSARPSGPIRITNFFSGGCENPAAAAAAGPTARVPAPQHSAQLGPGRHQPHQQAAGGPYAQSSGIAQPGHVAQGSAAALQAAACTRPAVAHGGAHAAGPTLAGAAAQQPQGPQRLPCWVPEYHTIPGTRLLVDCFGPASKRVPQGACPFWVLTHFHADHYKGLTKSFAGGTVLASPVTARLVAERLRLPAARLQTVAMDTPTVVDGARLTFVDANHCPGAAMVVAEPPGGAPAVLHTGDCRLASELMQHPALQALVGRRCTLVLDTTYCHPQYVFPTQRAVVEQALAAVKAESFNKRTLYVFGSYTIGKERLFLEVAAELGAKVYCCKEKAATLAACGLVRRYADLITTNHLEANIHAVPLFKVTLDGLAAILHQYKGRYNTIVGFQPTGWAQGSAGKGSGAAAAAVAAGKGSSAAGTRQQRPGTCGRRMQRGTVVVYQMPYSEHSSFPELRAFVDWLQPGRIIPSVGNDGPSGANTRAMLQLLTEAPAAGAAAAGGGRPAGGDIRRFLGGASAPKRAAA